MAKPAKVRHSLSDQLREIIHSRGLNANALGKLAGVDQGVISRFLAGRRSITLDPTADRIAAAIGVRFVEVGAGRRAAGGTRAAKPKGG